MGSSTFRLTTAFRHGRTKIDDVYFEAPFKLMTPFTNGRHSDFIVMLASPGFLKGDEAHIAIDFAPGTDSTIRTQSYEKVLDTSDGMASRTIDLKARGDAKAVFLPFPVIPFRNSTFENLTTARISAESTFVYGDVVTCGRVGMDERWAMHRFTNRLRVIVDEPAAVTKAFAAAPVPASASSATSPSPAAPAVSSVPVSASSRRSGDGGSGADSAGSASPRRGRPRKSETHLPQPRLAFADRMLLEPSSFDYTEMGMWREFTHCGVLYIHLPELDPADSADPNAVDDSAAADNGADRPTNGANADRSTDDSAEHDAASTDTTPDMTPDAVRERVETARIAAEDALIDRIRAHADAIGFTGELGASRAIDGVCVRVLTKRGDDAFDLIRDIAAMATES